jgi:hypothetical protein
MRLDAQQGRSVPNDDETSGLAPGVKAAGHVVDVDASWLVPSDLAAVDALARLQVVVNGRAGLLRLHGIDGGLAELLDFVGLGDVMHLCRCCTATGVIEPRPD